MAEGGAKNLSFGLNLARYLPPKEVLTKIAWKR
jgi:hypothetical protein